MTASVPLESSTTFMKTIGEDALLKLRKGRKLKALLAPGTKQRKKLKTNHITPVDENTTPNIVCIPKKQLEITVCGNKDLLIEIINELKTLDSSFHAASRVKWSIGSFSNLTTPNENIQDSEIDYYNAVCVIRKCLEKIESLRNIDFSSLSSTFETNLPFPGSDLLKNSLIYKTNSLGYTLENKYEEMLHSLLRFSLRKYFNPTKLDWEKLEDPKHLNNCLCIASNFLGSFQFNGEFIHSYILFALEILNTEHSNKKERASAFSFLKNLSTKRCMKAKLKNITESFFYKFSQKFPSFIKDNYSYLDILLKGRLLDINVKEPKIKLRKKDFRFPRLACDTEICNSCEQKVKLINGISCDKCKKYLHYDDECAFDILRKNGTIRTLCIQCHEK